MVDIWQYFTYYKLCGDKMKKLNILTDKNKILREKSKEVTFPLSREDKDTINDIIKYLKYSQIEEYAEKYDIRPGMGLAFIQLGMPKRIFVVVHEKEDGEFENYVVINPKVVSHSKEMIYAGGGEGCLSVTVDIPGVIPRHARLTVKAYDVNGNEVMFRVREEVAVAFEHELDHLEGMLYYDKIDKKNPYANMDQMREL